MMEIGKKRQRRWESCEVGRLRSVRTALALCPAARSAETMGEERQGPVLKAEARTLDLNFTIHELSHGGVPSAVPNNC